MGSNLNITILIKYILKNNIENREELLKYISNCIECEYTDYSFSNSIDGDKKIIKSLFPTKESIKNFFRIKNAINIAHFYNSFYEEDESISSKSSILTENANVYCSLGSGISKFLNLSSKQIINSQKVVCSNNKNIKPFLDCKVCKICNPNLISEWTKKSNIEIIGNAVLLDGANNICSYGGIISTQSNNIKSEKASIKIPRIEKEEVLEFSPYKTEYDLEKVLEEKIFNKNTKENILKILKTNTGSNYFFYALKIVIVNILKPNFDELNLKSRYSIAIYSEEDNKIYDFSNIVDEAIEYLKAINLKNNNKLYLEYKDELDAKTFISEYKKTANYTEKKYESSKKEYDNQEVRWMKVVLKEYNKYKNQKENTRGTGSLRNKIIIYHKIGGGIDANYKTPWCASFVNWVLNSLKISNIKTPSSQEMKKYLDKIDNAKYGSILILSQYDKFGNKTGKGHITFIVSKTNTKYKCLGGNQNDEIKYSEYYIDKKTAIRSGYLLVDGIYWPKNQEIIGEDL